MPGSTTTPGRPSARVGALNMSPSATQTASAPGTRFSIAAQWLACPFPCRRFADVLTDACARLGADVKRRASWRDHRTSFPAAICASDRATARAYCHQDYFCG